MHMAATHARHVHELAHMVKDGTTLAVCTTFKSDFSQSRPQIGWKTAVSVVLFFHFYG